ncbi:MAG: shikimate dehydrogenase [Candidatus Taylorbacteria bacterium CG11_big_fil_rev_8_21_14_0_20_46_11]|uniref:Shikimate dehydrogenase (NADP(+)) n=1 Tax=Candidatus Taylorbacteria bacterium CG11_big_fil_rev_8_21_14_0_20_46_11 TaxID=1975025 RepID=A0A2H0KCU6_9BACT|nr:MAG: shikimate dehydrogenase [Candidatus Taylorbacteria bacterium CG11_big_fil_rev_8_21_14_0_20_46_11]
MKKELLQLHAVIGYPLEHSLSPKLHNQVYELLKLSAVLLPFSHPDIKALVSAIRTLPIHLTAVTMPFKQSIIPLLDSVDGGARKIHAVNTVMHVNGKLHGYNTDIAGIEYALRDTPLKNRNVVLVGAGGAARAVAYVVEKAGGNLLYMNRTVKHAEELRKVFGGFIVTSDSLSPEGVDVIINATPVGMYPKVNDTPVPEALLRKGQTVFDLVYNPMDTKLLKQAKKKGARVVSGLDMFVVQGLRQIELWTGKKIIEKKLVERVKRNILNDL